MIHFESITKKSDGPLDLVGQIETDPKEWGQEEADIAFDMERNLMKYYSEISYELDVVRNWIDNCKAIQAQVLENKEETDGTT